MQAWSHVFLEGAGATAAAAAPCWSTCQVVSSKWNQLFEENTGAQRLFAKIAVPGAHPALTTYCALGAPLHGGQMPHGTEEGAAILLPAWVLERLGLEGFGEPVEVEWYPEEAFPPATRVVLQPHDSAFYHADAKEELERALTTLGVVTQGATIPIPLEALGGFVVSFTVAVTEPANVVLAEGDEVAMEFEEALDAAAQRAPVPVLPEPVPEPVDFGGLLPVAAAEPPASASGFAASASGFAASASGFAASGRVLGGGPVRRTADGKPWNPWRDLEAKPDAAAVAVPRATA